MAQQVKPQWPDFKRQTLDNTYPCGSELHLHPTSFIYHLSSNTVQVLQPETGAPPQQQTYHNYTLPNSTTHLKINSFIFIGIYGPVNNFQHPWNLSIHQKSSNNGKMFLKD